MLKLFLLVSIVLIVFLDNCSDVNELLIRNESESSGGSLTDTVEELLKGMYGCDNPPTHAYFFYTTDRGSH